MVVEDACTVTVTEHTSTQKRLSFSHIHPPVSELSTTFLLNEHLESFMDWRSNGNSSENSLALRSRGRGRGQGRSRGRGRGRGRGGGTPAPHTDSSSIRPVGKLPEERLELPTSNTTVKQSSKDTASLKASPQAKEPRSMVPPQKKGRDKLPSTNSKKPSLDSLVTTSDSNVNHSNVTLPTSQSGTRPRSNRRKFSKHFQIQKESSPTALVPPVVQTSELRSNIDNLVERVRAMAMANASPNKLKDGETASKVNENHFDWAEDDGDTLSDLGDDWAVSKGKSDAEQIPEISSLGTPAPISLAHSHTPSSNNSDPVNGLTIDASNTTLGKTMACNPPTLDGIPTAIETTSESLSSSVENSANLLERESIQNDTWINEDNHPTTTTEVTIDVQDLSSETTTPRKRAFDSTIDWANAPPVDPSSKAPNNRFRTNIFKSHSRVTSPIRRIPRDPSRPKSEFGSPERNHYNFRNSSHSRTHSTPKTVTSRIHATRPVITQNALSIISKTLGGTNGVPTTRI